MYIHFDLPSDRQTQKRLHREFRHKIRYWKSMELVDRAVLTYHFPHGSLYVCLDIPTVKERSVRDAKLSSETTKQIPPQIMEFMNDVCHQNNIKLGITNYRLEIEQAKKRQEEKGKTYYDGAPVQEILRFASIGTEIAHQVLLGLEADKKRWHSDTELANFILSQLKEELGMDYEWLNWALHFVCNPLLIPEYSIVYPIRDQALKAILSRL